MKCDGCGCQFSPREARTESRNVPIRPGSRHAYTRIEVLTLCPNCIASRATTRRFIIGLVLLLPIFAILVAVAGSWLVRWLQ